MTTIKPIPPLDIPPLDIPDPEAIRSAIDATDERARLLRRLLRLAMRLRLPLTTGGSLPPGPTKHTPTATASPGCEVAG